MASRLNDEPERRVLTVAYGSRVATVAWYLPGTSTQDIRDALAARLLFPAHTALTLEDEQGAALALSPGLPSGLTARLTIGEHSTGDEPKSSPPLPAAAPTAAPAGSQRERDSERETLLVPLLSRPAAATGCCSSGWVPLELETDRQRVPLQRSSPAANILF